MIRAFVDASVLVAAVFSPKGGASALLEMAIRGRVDLLISDDIVKSGSGLPGPASSVDLQFGGMLEIQLER